MVEDTEYDKNALGSACNTKFKSHELVEFNTGRRYMIEPERPNALHTMIRNWGGKGLVQILRSVMQTVVIGNDDREPKRSDKYPYRSIALLVCKVNGKAVGYGTGFFISSRCLITAGHCVHNGGRWMDSIEVIPGAMATDPSPFGSDVSTDFRSVDGWVVNKDRGYDYGAVLLKTDALYKQVEGHMGFDSMLEARGPIEVAGYPRDRTYVLTTALGEVLDASELRLDHNADTNPGMSGGPLYDPTTYMVKGVQYWGTEFGNVNYAIRLRPKVAKQWQDWSQIDLLEP